MQMKDVQNKMGLKICNNAIDYDPKEKRPFGRFSILLSAPSLELHCLSRFVLSAS